MIATPFARTVRWAILDSNQGPPPYQSGSPDAHWFPLGTSWLEHTRLARAKDIFGPGKSAEMCYYRTSKGAKVFAAGVMNFTVHADRPIIDKLLTNVFAKLEVR